jgi:hypothetical protein
MKDFIKINNRDEFKILTELYDNLGWMPEKPGLIAELSDNRFPVFVSHCDKYTWKYEGEDKKDVFDIRSLSNYHEKLGNIHTVYIKMSEIDINPPFYRVGPQMNMYGSLDIQFSDVVRYVESEHNGSLFHVGGMPINIWKIKGDINNPQRNDNCMVIMSKIVSIKRVQLRTARSYEEVGAVNKSGEANNYDEWYWKVTLGTGGIGPTPEDYDYSFLEFRLFLPSDWHASEFRFEIHQDIDSNYMYYTIS